MPETYFSGPLLVVAIALGWLAVQSAWARTFAAELEDPDPLAGRNCESCDCLAVCRRRAENKEKDRPK